MLGLPEILFTIVSFITIFIYHVVAESESWDERHNRDLANIAWQASQSIIWTLGVLSLRNGPELSIWAALPILPTALIYGRIAEIPVLRKDLNALITSPTGISVLIGFGVVFIGYLGYIIYNLIGKTAFSVALYFLPLFVYSCWLMIWINIPIDRHFLSNEVAQDIYLKSRSSFYFTDRSISGQPYNKSISKYYFHHWMIALIGVFVSKHPTIVSDLGLGIFWGIFIQEMAAYGIDIPVT